MKALVSFTSFQGEITVITVRVKEKSNSIWLIRVGIFDGIRKLASLETNDVPVETDELLECLRKNSATCRRMIDTAIGTFVRVDFTELHNVLSQSLEGDALKEWKDKFENHIVKTKKEKDEENYIPKDWIEDSVQANDKVTEGFQSICNSYEQFGDLRLESWRFSPETISRHSERTKDVDETCRSLIQEDATICKRLASLLTFMKIYMKCRGENHVAALLEAMKQKCNEKYCGGGLLRVVVRRSRIKNEMKKKTKKKKRKEKLLLPGPRLQRFITDCLRITFLYIVPARDALETTFSRNYNNNSPEHQERTAEEHRRKHAFRVLKDAENALQRSRENIELNTNVAKTRKTLTEKAKRAFAIADRVSRRTASMLTRQSAMSTWSSWWVNGVCNNNFVPAGRQLVMCACEGDIGQLVEILQHVKSFLKIYPETLTLTLKHEWSKSDRDHDRNISLSSNHRRRRRPKIGHTALIEAVRSRNCEIVRVLIQHGASLEVRDCNGRSLLEVSRFEDPEIRRPHLEQITLMIEAAKCDRSATKSPSKLLTSALLFASTYRSSHTPKLPRDIVGCTTQSTRAATVQNVYMSRLAEGKSAHIQQHIDNEEVLLVNEEEEKKEKMMKKKKKKQKSKLQIEVDIEEHARHVAYIDEMSESAERAIRHVTKRKKNLENAYDTIERLQNMLIVKGSGSSDDVVVDDDDDDDNDSEKRRRNYVVLRCLSRIRRNKLFASAFRRWSSVTVNRRMNVVKVDQKEEKWKQKYKETSTKLDALQKKFDEVMPILIAAAERAVGSSSSNNKNEQSSISSTSSSASIVNVAASESTGSIASKSCALEKKKKELSAVVNSKSCIVM